MRMPTDRTAVLSAAPSTDWRLDAQCTTEPPDDFFPIGDGPAARQQAERAKAVCRSCPVREPCLAWALDHDVRHGVFGGTDEGERQRLRAPRPRAGE